MTSELPDPIRFGREICGDLAQAERREWWLANGLGGYAAGTVAGTLTRRYHGLLIAPIDLPLGRRLIFAKADATLIEGGVEQALHTNRWGSGAVEPRGHLALESFRMDGRTPVWRFAFGRRAIEMRIWMEHGAHTTYLAYRLLGEGDEILPTLRVSLLVNARDHHGSAAPGSLAPRIVERPARLEATLQDGLTIHFLAQGGTLSSRSAWIEDFDLPVERERGLPDRDAHLCVGEALLDLRPDEWVGITASLDPAASPYLGEAMRRAGARESSLLAEAGLRNPELRRAPGWIRQLVLASDSFVFERQTRGGPGGQSVIAGYPWFGDWGRDTMIALPGLTLACGRIETARAILETFARFVDGGMLPNVFPGSGETPEYNTVDAALWYIEAWRAYLDAIDDRDALARVFPVLEQIVAAYRDGTRYGIAMDPEDGLIRAGAPGVQLTWMDAKVGDWVVTPRAGKPVEISALWFNALSTMIDFAERLGRDAGPLVQLRERAQAGFARFRRADGLGLYDLLDGPEGADSAIRPNQILAVSLPHSALDAAAQQEVVRVVGDRLLTSYGLRSLDPADPRYRPWYGGDVLSRDGAYHQGPVWAWLLGHYAMAEFRVTGDAAAAQARLAPLRDHLGDAGLGTISEILDGAAPHLPRGCPAQAWSVACTLEAWLRLERAIAARSAASKAA